MTLNEIAEWLLHHPDFNPEQLVSFDTLVRSHVKEHILEAIQLIPNIDNQLKTVIVTDNFGQRESDNDAFEFSIRIIGHVDDNEAINMLLDNRDLFRNYDGLTMEYFNEAELKDQTQTLPELCIDFIKAHPGARSFEAAGPPY